MLRHCFAANMAGWSPYHGGSSISHWEMNARRRLRVRSKNTDKTMIRIKMW